MDLEYTQTTVWSLSPAQLSRQCRLIAEDDSATIDPALQAEARRLYAAWQDALQLPSNNFEARERIAAQQAGIRKRTIEILLKIAAHQPGNA